MNKSKRFYAKTIAAFLVVLFTFSELAQAAGFETVLPVIAQDVSRFEAPFDFANLKEIHQGQNGRLIIHIQDAHSNFSGQENLAKALDFLMNKYKLNLVLSEGGQDDCSLTPLKKLASDEVWKRLARSFLIQGKISGEEYLNLTSNHPMKIMGLEDLDLYLKSVQNYALLADQRTEILDYLKQIKNRLEKIKTKSYPEELLNYERSRRSDSREEFEGFEKDFEELLRIAKEKEIKLDAYPNILKFLELKLKEKLISFDLANLEQAALFEALDKSGAVGDLKRELEKANQLKNSKTSLLAYFQNTFDIAKSKGVLLEKFPNLLNYKIYLEDFADMDLERLIAEFDKVEEAVYASLLKKEDGRILHAIDRYIRLLVTAYNIQMTTKEFELFQLNEPDFVTEAYLGFINRRLAEEGYFEEMLVYQSILAEGRKALQNFYDSVRERDFAFLKNAENILTEENQKVAVLISGGYHTQHLKKLFLNKGYSMAILTPFVNTETNQEKYEKLLLGAVRPERKKVESVQGESKKMKSLSALEREFVRVAAEITEFLQNPKNSDSRLAQMVYAATDEKTASEFLTDLARQRTRLEGSRLSEEARQESSDGWQSLVKGVPGTKILTPDERRFLSRAIKYYPEISEGDNYFARRFEQGRNTGAFLVGSYDKEKKFRRYVFKYYPTEMSPIIERMTKDMYFLRQKKYNWAPRFISTKKADAFISSSEQSIFVAYELIEGQTPNYWQMTDVEREAFWKMAADMHMALREIPISEAVQTSFEEYKSNLKKEPIFAGMEDLIDGLAPQRIHNAYHGGNVVFSNERGREGEITGVIDWSGRIGAPVLDWLDGMVDPIAPNIRDGSKIDLSKVHFNVEDFEKALKAYSARYRERKQKIFYPEQFRLLPALIKQVLEKQIRDSQGVLENLAIWNKVYETFNSDETQARLLDRIEKLMEENTDAMDGSRLSSVREYALHISQEAERFTTMENSFLNRHLAQWSWMQENLLQDLIRRKEDKEINVIVLGSSTGEEVARSYFEITKALIESGQNVRDWKIKINGYDYNEEVVEESRKRLTGKRGFRVESRLGDDLEYSSELIRTLNRYRAEFAKSFEIQEKDILETEAIQAEMPRADIILLNHVLRNLNSDQNQKLFGNMDRLWPNAVLAIGDQERSLPDSSRETEHLYAKLDESYASEPKTDFNRTRYLFGLPASLADRLTSSELSGSRLAQQRPQGKEVFLKPGDKIRYVAVRKAGRVSLTFELGITTAKGEERVYYLKIPMNEKLAVREAKLMRVLTGDPTFTPIRKYLPVHVGSGRMNSELYQILDIDRNIDLSYNYFDNRLDRIKNYISKSLFTVTQKIPGEALEKAFAVDERFSGAEALRELEAIAQMFVDFHELGVFNRDASPQEIFIDRSDPEHPRPYLIDYGLAVIQNSSSSRYDQDFSLATIHEAGKSALPPIEIINKGATGSTIQSTGPFVAGHDYAKYSNVYSGDSQDPEARDIETLFHIASLRDIPNLALGFERLSYGPLINLADLDIQIKILKIKEAVTNLYPDRVSARNILEYLQSIPRDRSVEKPVEEKAPAQNKPIAEINPADLDAKLLPPDGARLAMRNRDAEELDENNKTALLSAEMLELYQAEYDFVAQNHPVLRTVQARVDDLLSDREPRARPKVLILASKGEGVNAMAFENNVVVLTPELLEFIEYSEELDYVLLHEINHIQREHHAAIKNARSFRQIAGAQRFSEYEADLLTLERSNPKAGIEFLQRLRSSQKTFNYDLAHGSLDDRIINLKSMMRLYDVLGSDQDLTPKPEIYQTFAANYPKSRKVKELLVQYPHEGRQWEIWRDNFIITIQQSNWEFINFLIRDLSNKIKEKEAQLKKVSSSRSITFELQSYHWLLKKALKKWNNLYREKYITLKDDQQTMLAGVLLASKTGLSILSKKDEALLNSSDLSGLNKDFRKAISQKSLSDLWIEVIGYVEGRIDLDALSRFVSDCLNFRLHQAAIFDNEDGEIDIDGYGRETTLWINGLRDHFDGLYAGEWARRKFVKTIWAFTASKSIFNLIDLGKTDQVISHWAEIVHQATEENKDTARIRLSDVLDYLSEDAEAAKASYEKTKRILQSQEFQLLLSGNELQKLRQLRGIIDELKQSAYQLDDTNQRHALLLDQLAQILSEFPDSISTDNVRKVFPEYLGDGSDSSEFYTDMFIRSISNDIFLKDPEFKPAKKIKAPDVFSENPELSEEPGLKKRRPVPVGFGIRQLETAIRWYQRAAEPSKYYLAMDDFMGLINKYYSLFRGAKGLGDLIAINKVMRYSKAGRELIAEGDVLAMTPIASRLLYSILKENVTVFFEVLPDYLKVWKDNTTLECSLIFKQSLASLKLKRMPADKVTLKKLIQISFFISNIVTKRNLQEYLFKEYIKVSSFEEAMSLLFEEFSAQDLLLGPSVFEYVIEEKANTPEDLEKVKRAAKKILTNQGLVQSQMGILVAQDTALEFLIRKKSPMELLEALIFSAQDERKLRQLIGSTWWKLYKDRLIPLEFYDFPEKLSDVKKLAADTPNLFDEMQKERALGLFDDNPLLQFKPAQEILDALYKLGASERFVLLRKLLTGEKGALKNLALREVLLEIFLNAYLNKTTDLDLLKEIEFVLFNFFNKAPSDELYLMLSQLLQERFAAPPLEPGSWEVSLEPMVEDILNNYGEPLKSIAVRITKSIVSEDELLLDPEGGKRLKNAAADIQSAIKDAIRQRLLKLMNGIAEGNQIVNEKPEENLYRMVLENTSQTEQKKLEPIQLVSEVARQLGAPGVRFLQLLGQAVDIPEEYRAEFIDIYDSMKGQSKLAAWETIKREMPEYASRIKRFVSRLGGGSLFTVYEVELKDGTHEVVRVLNPNALYHARFSIGLIRQTLNQLAAAGPKYEQAKPIVDLLEKWIEAELKDPNFDQDDERFRQWQDFRVGEVSPQIKIPLSIPTGTPYVRREELIQGKNLTDYLRDKGSWTPDEQKKLKAFVALAAQHYAVQIANGLVHSDVSPGNLRITKDEKLAILDRGMYLKFSQDEVAFLFKLFSTESLEEKIRLFTEWLSSLPENNLVRKNIRIDQIADQVKQRSQKHGGDIEQSFMDTLIIVQNQGLQVPLQYMLLFKNLNALRHLAISVGFKSFADARNYAYTEMSEANVVGTRLSLKRDQEREMLKKILSNPDVAEALQKRTSGWYGDEDFIATTLQELKTHPEVLLDSEGRVSVYLHGSNNQIFTRLSPESDIDIAIPGKVDALPKVTRGDPNIRKILAKLESSLGRKVDLAFLTPGHLSSTKAAPVFTGAIYLANFYEEQDNLALDLRDANVLGKDTERREHVLNALRQKSAELSRMNYTPSSDENFKKLETEKSKPQTALQRNQAIRLEIQEDFAERLISKEEYERQIHILTRQDVILQRRLLLVQLMVLAKSGVPEPWKVLASGTRLASQQGLSRRDFLRGGAGIVATAVLSPDVSKAAFFEPGLTLRERFAKIKTKTGDSIDKLWKNIFGFSQINENNPEHKSFIELAEGLSQKITEKTKIAFQKLNQFLANKIFTSFDPLKKLKLLQFTKRIIDHSLDRVDWVLATLSDLADSGILSVDSLAKLGVLTAITVSTGGTVHTVFLTLTVLHQLGIIDPKTNPISILRDFVARNPETGKRFSVGVIAQRNRELFQLTGKAFEAASVLGALDASLGPRATLALKIINELQKENYFSPDVPGRLQYLLKNVLEDNFNQIAAIAKIQEKEKELFELIESLAYEGLFSKKPITYLLWVTHYLRGPAAGMDQGNRILQHLDEKQRELFRKLDPYRLPALVRLPSTRGSRLAIAAGAIETLERLDSEGRFRYLRDIADDKLKEMASIDRNQFKDLVNRFIVDDNKGAEQTDRQNLINIFNRMITNRTIARYLRDAETEEAVSAEVNQLIAENDAAGISFLISELSQIRDNPGLESKVQRLAAKLRFAESQTTEEGSRLSKGLDTETTSEKWENRGIETYGLDEIAGIQEAYRKIFEQVIPASNLSQKSILEIGSGRGVLMEYALDRGVRSFTALDINQKMLDAAQERLNRKFSKEDLEARSRLLKADMFELDQVLPSTSPENKFDYILIPFVLNFYDGDAKTKLFQSLKAHLNKNGNLVIITRTHDEVYKDGQSIPRRVPIDFQNILSDYSQRLESAGYEMPELTLLSTETDEDWGAELNDDAEVTVNHNVAIQTTIRVESESAVDSEVERFLSAGTRLATESVRVMDAPQIQADKETTRLLAQIFQATRKSFRERFNFLIRNVFRTASIGFSIEEGKVYADLYARDEGNKAPVLRIELTEALASLEAEKTKLQPVAQALSTVQPTTDLVSIALRDFRYSKRELLKAFNAAQNGQIELSTKLVLHLVVSAELSKPEVEQKIAFAGIFKSLFRNGDVRFVVSGLDGIPLEGSDSISDLVGTEYKTMYEGELSQDLLELAKEVKGAGVIFHETLRVSENTRRVIPEIPMHVAALLVAFGADEEQARGFLQRYTQSALSGYDIRQYLADVPDDADVRLYRDKGLIVKAIAALEINKILESARMVLQAIGSAA